MKRDKLRRARLKKGLSQDAAAGLVGVSRTTWSLWETGMSHPYPLNVKDLCAFFGVSDPADLDLEPAGEKPEDHASTLPSAPASYDEEQPFSGSTLEAGIEHMKADRRLLLKHMYHLVGSTVAAPHIFFPHHLGEQFAETFTNTFKMDDITLTHLEAITKSQWNLFLHASSKVSLLNSFWGHLQTLAHLLTSVQSGAKRNRLFSLAGEVAHMVGEILFDMQEYQHAQSYYELSIAAAKEAGNTALRVAGLGRLGFLSIYREEPQRARPLLEEAHHFLLVAPGPTMHPWLAVIEAEVMACLQDETACEKALERAMMMYNQKVQEEDRLWTRFNDATIPGYQGACFLRLQRPQKALTALEQALSLIPEYSHRHRSLILTDMAAALLQMKEIEETCKLLQASLEITTETKSLLIMQRMQRVRTRLESWKETSYVKHLDLFIGENLPAIAL